MDSETGSYELFLGQNFCTLISGNEKVSSERTLAFWKQVYTSIFTINLER